nr:fimbria/pilus outer membrane usher protein [Dyella sp. ASV24]
MSHRNVQSKQVLSRVPLRLGLLPALVALSLMQQVHADPAAPAAGPAASGGAVFDMDFFPAGTAPKVDLSNFEKSGYVAPGTYRGDVVLNEQWRARTDIVFASEPGSDSVQPCFDSAKLAQYGIDLGKVASNAEHAAVKTMPKGNFCGQLGDYIPGATTEFDAGAQVLTLQVPQIYLQQSARGYVDPSQWDAGINAATVSYNANAYRTTSHGGSQTSAYLGLNTSLNLGSWHAFHQGSLSMMQGRGRNYQSAATYLQHDVPAWQAQLVAGDTFTPGDMFDSVRLRGVRAFSDDRMLPQSMRGFAPVVRGIAETNAKVTIRQRGYLIYETNVAPGPFSIDDLYPTGYGGDLDVEVTEADGRTKHFAVPFSAVAQLLRPGQARWSLAAGQVSQQGLHDSPHLVQGTYQRGLTNRMTAYGGATLSSGYRAILLGGALNTEAGAFSLDLTQASNRLQDQSSTQGMSLRLGYNKNFVDTGTDFAVAAYRYSTSGYVGLNDAVAMRGAVSMGGDSSVIQRQRSRMDVSINQRLGDRGGSLFLTGSLRDYWNSSGRQVDFTAGYNNTWRSVSYSFSAQRTRDSISSLTSSPLVNRIPGVAEAFVTPTPGRRDTRIFFSMSVPLGRSANAPTLMAMTNRSSNDGDTSQASLSGSLGAERRFNYSGTLSRSPGNTSVSLSSQYAGSSANISAGASHSTGYNQMGVGASGGVVIHSGGVTFAPPLGDTVGLIVAPDAAGARVENGQGAVVDKHGYAVVPYLMPYELNTIRLDPKGTAVGVELDETSVNTSPRLGSVVRLRYKTKSGRALMIDSSLPDGRPLPFGADVLDAQGANVGVVGQASRLVVTGLAQSGSLTVRWSDDAADTCRIDVQLASKPAKAGGYEMLKAPCVSGASNTTAPLQPTSAAWHRISELPGHKGSVRFPSIALDHQVVV